MGAGGFIGSAIADSLQRDGTSVLRVTRNDIDLLASGASLQLEKLLRTDDVFIAASAMAPCKNPAMLRDNMIMAETMVSALSRACVAHVINISSDAVYTDSTQPLTETSPKSPENLHGVMHLARELMFQTLVTPLAIVRPTLVYGARDPHNGYGPNKFRRLANNSETIVLFGKGEEQRDHVMVDDVAELTIRIIKHGSTGVLTAATGNVTSFRAVADKVVELSAKKAVIKDSARNGPMPHNGYRAFSAEATKTAFPDFNYTPIWDGLKKVQAEEFGHGAR